MLFKTLAIIFILFELAACDECIFETDINKYICTEVVQKFPNRYYGSYELTCEKCNITVFDKSTFTGRNSLRSFNLSYANLKQIRQDAFLNLGTINFLYLNGNGMEDVSAYAFRGLTEMYEMHLENNDMSKLTVGFLSGVSANYISLHGNKIGEIDVGVFKGIQGVTNLNISSNGMYVLHPGSFKYLDGLEILDLQQNNLCNIPLGVLQDIPSLRELNLANNRISKFYIGTFSGLRELSKLNISHNRLKEFDDSVLLPLIHLINLDLSGNQLLYIDPHTLSNTVSSLKYLSINDNLWSCKQLTVFVTYMQNHNVDFSLHSTKHYHVPNIHGIVCNEDFEKMEGITFVKFLEHIQRKHEAFSRLSNYC